jgi:uncharacterized membrane protein YfcA
MPEALRISLLAGVAFVAALLAAVTGFGGAAVLLPMLVIVFGVREAIPILTVAQLIVNGSRVWFNRHELDWRVVAWFASGLALGPIMVAGSFVGKRVVDRQPERVFVLIIDVTLLTAGVLFLAGWSKL